MKKIKITITTLVMTLAIALAVYSGYSASASELDFPEYEFPTYHYETLEEAGISVSEIKAFFPEVLEVKYENGMYTIKDIGASSVEFFLSSDFERIDMTLVDGYWEVPIREEEFNNTSIDKYVTIRNEELLWEITYINGVRGSYVQISNPGNVNVILVYFDENTVEISYPLGETHWYTNVYVDGRINQQTVKSYLNIEGFGYCFAETTYNYDGSVEEVLVYIGGYYYYSEDYGWATNPSFNEEYLCDAPEALADANMDYFKELCPLTIGCIHDVKIPSDCLNPEICKKCLTTIDGSSALGHDIVKDLAVDPTCESTGLTEGSHCSRCDDMTVAQEEIPALGHEIVVDLAVDPTCEDTGLTEGSHCSRCDDMTVAQEEVPALGHEIVVDLAVDPTCEDTGLTEGSHCSRCDDMTVAQEEIPALGHDVVTDLAVDPTCVSTGLTEGSHCKECQEVLVKQKEVAKLEHDYSEIKHDESGHWKQCICGEKTEVEGHKGGEATTTEKAKCEVCGQTYGELKALEQEQPAPEEPVVTEEKGCSGSIVASVFSLVSLLGTVIVLRNKREE